MAMKICLVRVAFPDERNLGYLPTALLSLGAVLEEHRFKVKIVDLEPLIRHKKMSVDKNFHINAAKIIMKENINILGFTTRCDTYPSVLNIARRCKEIDPSCVIIFGGPQATLLDLETLQNFKFVDVIVRGEGELTIVELMNQLRRKNIKGFKDIKGITYREKDNRITRTSDRELIENLDSLPMLAYHLLDGHNDNRSKGSINDKQWTTIEAGRGCPYRCIFCSTSVVLRRTYRLKSPERIVKEIEILKNKYGIKHFFFLHDHLLFDKNSVVKMCNILIKKKLDIFWNCSSRPDNITPDLLKLMVKSGCIGIYFGVESGSQKIQKIIRKNINVSQAFNIIKECEKYNLLTGVSFILGFPDEKESDVNATLKFALDCAVFKKTFIQLHLLAAMPKTLIYEKFKDNLVFTGIFSDVSEGPVGTLKENLDLIKKYPSIFSVFYSVKPKYFSLNFSYNVVNLFLEVLRIYRVPCHIIMKEFNLTPLELFRKLYNQINKANKADVIITKQMVRRVFSKFAKDIYGPENTDYAFLKSIIKFEIKNYNKLIKEMPVFMDRLQS